MTKLQRFFLSLFIVLLEPIVNQSGKTGSPTTSSTTTQPWAGQQPHLQDVMDIAKKTYAGGFYDSMGKWNEAPGGPISYYPGQTIAGFTPEQKAAQNLATQRAGELTPVFESTANIATTAPTTPDYLMKTIEGAGFNTPTIQGKYFDTPTIRGDYLSPKSNPYLSHYVQKAYEETLPALDTTAMQAGRYGSEPWALLKGRTQADIVSNIYGGAYESERARQEAAYLTERAQQAVAEQGERGRQAAAEMFAPQLSQSGQRLQLQAATMAPQLAMQDVAMMGTVGAEKQAMQQAQIDAAKRKYEFEQMEPWQRLGMYSGLTSGNLGGVTTATTTPMGGK